MPGWGSAKDALCVPGRRVDDPGQGGVAVRRARLSVNAVGVLRDAVDAPSLAPAGVALDARRAAAARERTGLVWCIAGAYDADARKRSDDPNPQHAQHHPVHPNRKLKHALLPSHWEATA